MLTLFHPSTGQVRVKGVTSCPNVIFHAWLEVELSSILDSLPPPRVLPERHNQAAWEHDGILGYAAYKVADTVQNHELWGGGAYIYTIVDPTLHATHGFEVPVTPGVRMHDLLTVSLNHAGTIDHVVNDVGDAVTPDHAGPSYVVSYP